MIGIISPSLSLTGSRGRRQSSGSAAARKVCMGCEASLSVAPSTSLLSTSTSEPPSNILSRCSTREKGSGARRVSRSPNCRGKAWTELWHVASIAATVVFIHVASRALRRAGRRLRMRSSSCVDIARSQTRMWGCSDPRPCASISPRKANTGPKAPGALAEAATPSVHHSRGGFA